jgi:hypothetical protein
VHTYLCMSKRCGKCDEVNDVAEFHRNSSSKDGLQRSGKPCQLEYLKSHYWRNRQYYIDKARRRNRVQKSALKELIRSMKSVPCADCKGVFSPWIMQFDHVRGLKLFDLGKDLEHQSTVFLTRSPSARWSAPSVTRTARTSGFTRARSSVD